MNLQPISFIGTRFFDVVTLQSKDHYVTSLVSMTKGVILLDMKKASDKSLHKKYLAQLDWIFENTTKRLLIPLAEAEALVAYHREIGKMGADYGKKNNVGEEPRDRNGNIMKVMDIDIEMRRAADEIMVMFIDIVKSYAADYRIAGGGSDWDKQ